MTQGLYWVIKLMPGNEAGRGLILLLLKGGLGPTWDDIARGAVGELVTEELKIDENSWQESEALLRHYAGEMSQSNMKQATIIPAAQVIPNRIGTAPR